MIIKNSILAGYTGFQCNTLIAGVTTTTSTTTTTPNLNLGIGSLTQLFSPCQTNPCLNGGNCLAVGNIFVCTCAIGYQGTLCQSCTFFLLFLLWSSSRLIKLIKKNKTLGGALWHRVIMEVAILILNFEIKKI